ncbi:hypothetical protein EK904_003379 [Melospiza melodia maxima]|nr:hypothetical protein EK904_003379 [Melospiza melodia maxima]
MGQNCNGPMGDDAKLALQIKILHDVPSSTLLVFLKIMVIIITGEEDDERQKSHSDMYFSVLFPSTSHRIGKETSKDCDIKQWEMVLFQKIVTEISAEDKLGKMYA